MNAKEMEALIKQQGVMIEALNQMAVDQGAVIEALVKEMEEIKVHRASIEDDLKKLHDDLSAVEHILQIKASDVHDQDKISIVLEELGTHVQELDVLVKGRNKSAAVKRNMTDDDARCVLTGEHKDLPHKEAAEKIGLTYAQVYSCRMEYTFKHVLHELRKAEWVNPWKK